MNGNVDDRLLGHWQHSRKRQETLRARLAQSSLSVANFESWALDLIADAVTDPAAGGTAPSSASTVRLITFDDR